MRLSRRRRGKRGYLEELSEEIAVGDKCSVVVRVYVNSATGTADVDGQWLFPAGRRQPGGSSVQMKLRRRYMQTLGVSVKQLRRKLLELGARILHVQGSKPRDMALVVRVYASRECLSRFIFFFLSSSSILLRHALDTRLYRPVFSRYIR